MENENKVGQEFLAYHANKVVSEGDENALSISMRIKHNQEVVGYVLSNGKEVSMEEAIEMAKENRLNHVGVAVSKNGEEYIRSLADGDESNNLTNLPSITL